MIQFNELKVEGGLSFKESTLFPLSKQGLCKIVGRNLDDLGSNGSGKSSIGDLLTHVLFATTAKGLKKSEIICDQSDTGFLAELNFLSGETPYKIIQARSHHKEGTGVKLFTNGVDAKIKGINESQDAVKRALGIDFTEWFSTTYLCQKADHLFVRPLENDAKKNLLARIFNLNYQAMREDSDARLKETRQALLALKANISASKATLEQTLLDLGNPTQEDLSKKISLGEKKLLEIQSQTNDLQTKLSNYLNYKITTAKKDNYRKLLQQQSLELSIPGDAPSSLEQCITALTAMQTYLMQLEEGLKNSRAHSKYYRDLLPHIEQRDRFRENFKPFEQWPEELRQPGNRNKALQDLNRELANLQALYGDYQGFEILEKLRNQSVASVDPKENQELMDREIYLRGYQNSNQAKIKEHEGYLATGKGGICPSCGQEVSILHLHDLAEELEKLKAKEVDIRLEICTLVELKTNLHQREKYYQDWSKSLKEYEDRFGHTSKEEIIAAKQAIQIDLDKLQRELDQVEQFQKAFNALQPYLGVEGELPVVKEYLVTLENNEKTYQDQIPKFQNYIGTLQEFSKLNLDPVEEVDELLARSQINLFQESAVELSAQVSSYKKDLETVKNIQAQLQAIQGKEDEILLLEQNEQIFESLSYSFGPKGLIVERLGTICEYMNEKANYFLSRIMKDDIRLKFGMGKDSIDLDILMKSKSRGTANLSGGEGGKVGLACMLGLRSLIPDKHQANLMILDEAENFMDDKSRFELMDLLRATLESTTLDTILMISHSQALQDSITCWDTTWEVTKQHGCSTLEVR